MPTSFKAAGAGFRVIACAALALGLGAFSREAVAGAPLTVLELFTSQGCSDCPPANDNVRALSDRPGVLALSFGVTYWDNLGWKDTFAQDAFTARQVAYSRSLGHEGPFTPQVVVDGRADVVGSRKGEIEQLASRVALAGGPGIVIRGDRVLLSGGTRRGPPADIWLVRYDPRTIEVPVRAGENDGHTLPHKNVVRQLVRLGAWTGQDASFISPPASIGLRTAVLVQEPQEGPILAAATT